MGSTASIGGLASGLDTSSIIEQLMQLEAVPQTRLAARVRSEQSLVSALQTLNTKAALLGSKAADLAKATTWKAVAATSSSTALTVNASSAASPTRLNVTVTALARTHQLAFADTVQLTDVVTGGSSGAATKVRLDRYDGTPVEIDSGDGTLSGLITAINDPANATGLRATAVHTGSGYRLLVESTATGAAQDFALTQDDGSPLMGGATVRAGADASIDLGSGLTVSSTSNTFTDVVPGVTLTLSGEAVVGSTATVDVAQDSGKLGAAVSDMVAAMNSLLTEVDTQTAFNATTKTGGPLSGDSTVRSLRGSVLSTVFTTDGTSLATLGIQTDRNGSVTFDSTKFAAAYAADPSGTEAMFTTAANGFAARLETVAKGASDPTSGTVTSAITGRRSGIDRLQESVDGWDLRLALRRESLNRQFTALETALSQMNSQSSWLTSQLSALS